MRLTGRFVEQEGEDIPVGRTLREWKAVLSRRFQHQVRSDGLKMPKAKITKRTVDGLAAGQTITDDAVRGFQARRLPSGNIRFTFRYSLPGSPQKEIKIGLHGELTADQARDLASDYAYKVRQGRDPVAELATATVRSGNTVGAVLDSYLERDVKARGLKSAAPSSACSIATFAQPSARCRSTT